MFSLYQKIRRKLRGILVKVIPYNTSLRPVGVYQSIQDYAQANRSNKHSTNVVEIFPGYDSELGVSDEFYAACSDITREPATGYMPASVVAKIDKGRILTDAILWVAVVSPDNKLMGEFSFEVGKTRIESHSVLTQKYFTTPVRVEGVAFNMLIGGAGINNYFHWLFDVLPRLHLLKKSGWFQEVDWFIIPSYKRRYQKETLQFLGINEAKVIEADKETHLQADTLIASTHVRHHSYIPQWACQFLIEEFSGVINSTIENNQLIYISRRDAGFRHILNEPEVIALMQQYGFTIVESGKLSFKEQVNLFASAKVIVATHGAGMSNIVFCRKGTVILELFPAGAVVPLYYHLANKVELAYNYLFCRADRPATNNAQSIRQNLTVDMHELKAKLDVLLLKDIVS